MPIHLSIKSPYVSGLDVSDTIIAAFAEASYPIKVKVSNTSSNKGLFPEVSGIVVPPHDPQSNDFAISKKISLASSSDVAKLAANVEYLAEQSKDSDVLFVISEISADSKVDEWDVFDDAIRYPVEKVVLSDSAGNAIDIGDEVSNIQYRPSELVLTKVNASATAVDLMTVAADTAKVLFFNNSTKQLKIGFGAVGSPEVVTATEFSFIVQPGEGELLSADELPLGVISGIWESAGGAVNITEFKV